MLRAVALAATLAGCYSPAYRDCEITCASGTCPAGLTCDEGVCRVAGATGSCGQTSIDAPLRDDLVGDDMQVSDASTDATTCSAACFRFDSSAGSAPCNMGTNNCVLAAPWLDNIELCACVPQASQPAMYTRFVNNRWEAAWVGVGNNQVALFVNDSQCVQGSVVCPAAATAPCTPADVWLFTNLGIVSNVVNSFEVYDGSCTAANAILGSYNFVPAP